MKCFRIDSGGETFYWAGETEEEAIAAFRDNYDEFADPSRVVELTDGEMALINVSLENARGIPVVAAPLKQVFEDETRAWVGGAFELCGSVY
jgi:hypothetical protein